MVDDPEVVVLTHETIQRAEHPVRYLGYSIPHLLPDVNLLTNRPLTTGLGVICGFNKSSTGGGYGPLSTSGFQLLGLAPPMAVGTTILAKGIACIISIVLWSGIVGINLAMAVPMTIGAFVGAPIAAWLNNYLKLKVDPPFHGRFLGLIMTALGVYTVLHVLGVV
jgi:uncharacterized membrane protein YfcA